MIMKVNLNAVIIRRLFSLGPLTLDLSPGHRIGKDPRVRQSVNK